MRTRAGASPRTSSTTRPSGRVERRRLVGGPVGARREAPSNLVGSAVKSMTYAYRLEPVRHLYGKSLQHSWICFINKSDMSGEVKRRHGLFSRDRDVSMGTVEGSVTPKRERDAREMAATMDYSDIRGLATAFHLFLAGLPRSRSWDHHEGARIKFAEDSSHRSRASRFHFGVKLGCGCSVAVDYLPGRRDWKLQRSGRDLHLPSDIPDKARKLPGDRHTAFVLCHFPSGVELAEPIGEAS